MNCLRTTVAVYRHGTVNRWETVAFVASCMGTDGKDGKEAEPPSAEDQVLQELYAEAVTFGAEGFARLRLIK